MPALSIQPLDAMGRSLLRRRATTQTLVGDVQVWPADEGRAFRGRYQPALIYETEALHRNAGSESRAGLSKPAGNSSSTHVWPEAALGLFRATAFVKPPKQQFLILRERLGIKASNGFTYVKDLSEPGHRAVQLHSTHAT